MSINKLKEALIKSSKTKPSNEELKLANSIKEEQKKVYDRFDNAEELLHRLDNSTLAVSKPLKQISPSMKLSLTILESENETIDTILDKFLRNGIRANKSQIVRLGISLIAELEFEELQNLYNKIEKRVVGKRLS